MNIKFNKIHLTDRKTICDYIQSEHHQNSIFSFGNNLFWDENHKLEYTIIEDVLIYRRIYDEVIRYCTPNFKQKWGLITGLIEEDAVKIGKSYRISSLKADDVEAIMGIGRIDYKPVNNPGQYDYIYSVEDLSALKGVKYLNKRNLTNFFRKNYSWEYQSVNSANKSLCLDFEKKWFDEKVSDNTIQDVFRGTLQMEKRAVEFAVDNFEQLELIGGLLFVNGECCGFSIGEKLNDSTFVQHFEKANRNIKGAYQMVQQQFISNELLGRYHFFNKEEDMGMENIRQSKMSYHPVYLYEKHTLYRSMS